MSSPSSPSTKAANNVNALFSTVIEMAVGMMAFNLGRRWLLQATKWQHPCAEGFRKACNIK